MLRRSLPLWTWLAPLAGWALLGSFAAAPNPALAAAIGVALIACVLAAVHQAEIIARRLGQPLGALVLALAVTVIEVALIVTLMSAEPQETTALARDTIFAEVMIVLNGAVGLCLVVGGTRHHEQAFGLHGTSAALATLATLAVMILILPNATIQAPGPAYSPAQLAFVGIVSLVLYLVFVFVQTVRHRDHFIHGEEDEDAMSDEPVPGNLAAAIGALLLLASLGAVVLCAHVLAPAVEAQIDAAGVPRAALGIAIGLVVLLPESISALRAAFADRLQTSLNLALGSALASIGLTIPVVAAVALAQGWTLVLGLDLKEEILLALSLLVATLSLGTGRTTILQGAVHLVIFAVYLFTAIVP